MFKIINNEGKTLNHRWKYFEKAASRAQDLSLRHSFHWFSVWEEDKFIICFKDGKEWEIEDSKNDSLVFVEYYMEFGDGDATTTGFVVLPKQTWEEQKQKFNQYLKDKGIESVTVEHDNMEEEVNLDMYDEKDCSEQDLQTITKLFGDCQSYRLKEGYLYFYGRFLPLEELMS
jgi:hypothetical protein